MSLVKNSKFLLLFMALYSLMFDANAQINNLSNDISGTPIKFKPKKDIDGSALYFENWVSGEVILRDGKKVLDLSLQYNVEDDKLYYRKDDEVYVIDNYAIQGFILKPNSVRIDHYFSNGFEKVGSYNQNAYFEVIYDGETKLLKKKTKEIKDRQNTGYGSIDASKYYYEQDSYYILKPDGQSEQVRLNKSSLLKAMSEKQSKLKKVIKSEGLKTNNLEDIKTLMWHYDNS